VNDSNARVWEDSLNQFLNRSEDSTCDEYGLRQRQRRTSRSKKTILLGLSRLFDDSELTEASKVLQLASIPQVISSGIEKEGRLCTAHGVNKHSWLQHRLFTSEVSWPA